MFPFQIVENYNYLFFRLSLNKLKSFALTAIKICNTQLCENAVKQLHTTAAVAGWAGNSKPRKWFKYNKVVYPPQLPDEEPRPAVSN